MAKKAVNRERKLYIVALECIGIAVCAFVVFACLSFNIADPPSAYYWPYNDPVKNWCGPVGAFTAYYLLYYFGPGIFVLAITVAAVLTNMLSDKKISQPAFRILGCIVLSIAFSAAVRMVWPVSAKGFPMGNGGILGIGIVMLLEKYVATLGAVIIVLCSLVIGAILLADSLVLAALQLTGLGMLKTFSACKPAIEAAQRSDALSQIWKKLSEKQKAIFQSDQTELSIAEVEAQAAEEIQRREEEKAKKASDQAKARAQKQTQLAEAAANAALQTGNDEEPAAGQTDKSKGESQIAERELTEDAVRLKARAINSATAFGLPAIKEPPAAAYIEPPYDNYKLPTLDLLMDPEYGYASIQEKVIKAKSAALEKVLSEFGIEAQVVDSEPGPTITMFEISLAAGIKVSQISNLANDIARALGAGAVRVVAPIPGKHTIGVEVPNSQKETVRLKDLIQRAGERYQKMQIPLFLGKDSSGEALVENLASMPHLLIAGTTGSGKSVCINSIITSIMMTKRPDEVKLILIDPKMVEMAQFSTVPHLMSPIVTEMPRAEKVLEWATTKMDERYALLAEAGVRNISSYNSLGTEELINRLKPSSPDEEAKIPKKLPYIVIIVDELADMMMTSGKEIEAFIVRLAQKSRAIGIHLILATQRPQATVVTGLIKSNMPCRISFRVASRMDSRIVLDQNGAETLLGQGDMLFVKPGTSELLRAQGAYVDDSEVRSVIKYLKEIAEPQFHPELMQLNTVDTSLLEKDDLFDDAVRIVIETQRGSVSLLQRKLGVGYARASRMIETMAAAGILGEYKGSQAREVLMTIEEWEKIQQQMAADAEAGYKDLQDDAGDDDVDEHADIDEESEHHAAKV